MEMIEERRMGFGWFLTRSLIFIVPAIGTIMAVYWAICSKSTETKSFARAVLVIYIFLAVAGLILSVLFGQYIWGMIK